MKLMKLRILFCVALSCGASLVHAANWYSVRLQKSITHPQPMTGLVLWPEEAEERNQEYGATIQLEFSYCLPCKVVTGCAADGTIQYDWSWFDNLLADVASRGHQLVARFRYEYPSGIDVDGQKGTTAVPDYIKQRSDYHETYASNAGGDGPTYYADWSCEELRRFTLQFYTDFAQRYAADNRLAFLEVGFGHWSEYHIYGTELELGTNFPSKDFQKQFFVHMSQVMTAIPWLVSIDAADDEYSPVVDDDEMMALRFGLFDDSFMHKNHEIGSKDGYNEECWNAIGQGTRWQTGVCGGEISYYSSKDQKNFLDPNGLYGHTWPEQAAKYHITFMIANDAPRGGVATPERFRDGSMATGYRFAITACETDGQSTRICITNRGIAPIYRDAWVAVGAVRSEQSLLGLLPGQELTITVAAPIETAADGSPLDGSKVSIVSDAILPAQSIEYEANIVPTTAVMLPAVDLPSAEWYSLDGRCLPEPRSGLYLQRQNGIVRKVAVP